VELRLLLKPFIPDMIPSVADVDAMLKVVFCLTNQNFYGDHICQRFVYSLA